MENIQYLASIVIKTISNNELCFLLVNSHYAGKNIKDNEITSSGEDAGTGTLILC